MVMGTAGYVAGAGAGQAVDHRTDIFAFGAVLYRDALGQARLPAADAGGDDVGDPERRAACDVAYAGKSSAGVAASGEDRCLEKNPEQRFHSASDLAFALDALSDSGAAPALATPAASRLGLLRPAIVWAVLAGIVAISLAAVWFALGRRNSSPSLRIAEYTQLTHNGHAGQVVGTDGNRLYLQNWPRSISQVSVSGGEIEPVASITLPDPNLLDISPDSSTFWSCLTKQ